MSTEPRQREVLPHITTTLILFRNCLQWVRYLFHLRLSRLENPNVHLFRPCFTGKNYFNRKTNQTLRVKMFPRKIWSSNKTKPLGGSVSIYKIIVTGPFNSGKTEFIKTVSDIPVVTTEKKHYH